MDFKYERYEEQNKKWPQNGQHILAQYTDEYVIVYQAFNAEIADFAVRHQKFGGPAYNFGRMTWIKTNFLWMMYRSNWAMKDKNQARILAIYVSVEGFEEILRSAYTVRYEKHSNTDRKDVLVRLQWDPDHDPYGNSVARRAMQLGLKSGILQRFNNEWIKKICDVTDFVIEQKRYVDSNEPEKLKSLLTPIETIYLPKKEETRHRIELTC